MKLLIRNLARTTIESELQKMFETYGRVQSCSLVLDKETGISKGFGFVEIPMLGEAKAAMKALNGKELDGNKIRVKKAEEKVTSEETEELVKQEKAVPNRSKVTNTPSKSVWEKRTKK
ncbi:MAG: RNA recognition motif-containing protein [Gammaproteobacteria bacterium]|jgi:RNA recognition motif-containing protein